MYSNPQSLMLNGRLISLKRPLVMGIVNVTPDSFYAESRVADSVLERVEQMLGDGADIIDVGACSTRPGSQSVSEEEEMRRLASPLREISRAFPDALISVDTFRAAVARCCAGEFGVRIINDISGGQDPEMFPLVASEGLGYVLMHTRGTPANMASLTHYDDVVAEVLSDLAFRLNTLRAAGAANVIVDPGFGFAKTLDQNYRLLAHLEVFKALEAPILVGISRKSMVSKVQGITPDESLPGTLALNTVAVMKGAVILRVHDVKETVQLINVLERL